MTSLWPVRIVTNVEIPTAVVLEATTWPEFPSRWPVLLDQVWSLVRASGLAAGRNVMLYKDDVPNVEVGVEIHGPFTAADGVVASVLPGGRAATAVATGAPSPATLARTHEAVRAWCAERGHALTGVRWEIYGHWLEDQDPDRFETEVYWLLASG